MGTRFDDDVQFLTKHVDVQLLESDDGARVAVVPEYQARVMTSTLANDDNDSFGWINREAVERGPGDGPINLFGGEDRFWIGPEGSRFSFFFDPGKPMTFANWRTPALIDSVPYEVVDQATDYIECRARGQMTNYQGQTFDMEIVRRIQMLSPLDLDLYNPEEDEGLTAVAFETRNCLTNVGDSAWTAENGLPSIWILGMYPSSSHVTSVLPVRGISQTPADQIVNTAYFGELDESRLRVDLKRRCCLFRCDGQYRSKIGIPLKHATDRLGSWNSDQEYLTWVEFDLPHDTGPGYCNNLWTADQDPFGGDVVNCYNDGPNESGGALGPFYELESSSPALPLAPGESYTHVHRTVHLKGEPELVDEVSRTILGVSLERIRTAFDES